MNEREGEEIGAGGAAGNPARAVNYALDLVGNRNQVTDSATGTVTYQKTNLNQYWYVGPDPIYNGSEHEIAGYKGISYGYINDGRLTSVSGNGNNYQIKYDALGRTISRTLNNQTTYYYYDGEWSELGSRDIDGCAGMGNL